MKRQAQGPDRLPQGTVEPGHKELPGRGVRSTTRVKTRPEIGVDQAEEAWGGETRQVGEAAAV